MNAIQDLAQENMRFVGETYGELAKGATRSKIIPILSQALQPRERLRDQDRLRGGL